VDLAIAKNMTPGRDCLTDHLYHLCNLIWKEGRMPKKWTKSVLVTIPKKGMPQNAAITILLL